MLVDQSLFRLQSPITTQSEQVHAQRLLNLAGLLYAASLLCRSLYRFYTEQQEPICVLPFIKFIAENVPYVCRTVVSTVGECFNTIYAFFEGSKYKIPHDFRVDTCKSLVLQSQLCVLRILTSCFMWFASFMCDLRSLLIIE